MDALTGRVLDYAISFCLPEKRRDIASGLCEGKAEYIPGDMLYAIRKRYGAGAALWADLILFGWCQSICLLADFLPWTGSFWMRIPAFLSCLFAFCLCRDQPFRAFLKGGFLCVSLITDIPWTLSAVILLLFEHAAVSGHLWGKGG